MDCGHVYVCVCYVRASVYVTIAYPPFMIALSLCFMYTLRRSVCTQPKQSIQNNESESETVAPASNSNNNKNINNNNNNNTMSIHTCVKSIVLNFTFMFSFTQQSTI